MPPTIEAPVKIVPENVAIALKGADKVNEHWDPTREIFVFHFKKGHAVLTQHIQADSLKDAITLGHDVCRIRKYTFIGVTPLIRDIRKLLDPTTEF